MISALKFFAKYKPYRKSWQLITLIFKVNSKLQNGWRCFIMSKFEKLQRS